LVISVAGRNRGARLNHPDDHYARGLGFNRRSNLRRNESADDLDLKRKSVFDFNPSFDFNLHWLIVLNCNSADDSYWHCLTRPALIEKRLRVSDPGKERDHERSVQEH
jgi:hypothetical protein